MKKNIQNLPSEKGLRSRYLPLLFFICFVGFVGIMKFGFHEFWKDEWQAWLLAVKTTSWTELVSYLPSEGHPILWFFLMRIWHGLFIFLHVDFLADTQLQSLHFFLTTIALAILFFRIKAPIWLKVAMASGYFFFFEYGVINRGYIIIVILCFYITSVFQKEKTNRFDSFLLPLSFFLLTQTEVYGIIIGGSFLVYLFFKEVYLQHFKCNKNNFILLVSILVSGAILFYFQVSPSSDSSGELTFTQLNENKGELFLQTLQSLSINLFWPGLFETSHQSGFSVLALLLGIFILSTIIYLFRNSKAILFGFTACFLGLFLFTMLIYFGGFRQWGNLIIAFFCYFVLWFENQKNKDWKTYFLIGSILLFHSIHNFRIVTQEIQVPFSNSKAAGAFIRKKFPEQIPIVGINKFFSVPVIGYSDRAFYSLPSGEKFYFFTINDWRSKMYIPSPKDLKLFKNYKKAPYLVVLFNKPLPLNRFPGLELVKYFNGKNIREENYFIYVFR